MAEGFLCCKRLLEQYSEFMVHCETPGYLEMVILPRLGDKVWYLRLYPGVKNDIQSTRFSMVVTFVNYLMQRTVAINGLSAKQHTEGSVIGSIFDAN